MTANKVLVKFAEHVQNGSVEVDTEVCEVKHLSGCGLICLAAWRVSKQLIEMFVFVCFVLADIWSGPRGGGHLELLASGHPQRLFLQVRVRRCREFFVHVFNHVLLCV